MAKQLSNLTTLQSILIVGVLLVGGYFLIQGGGLGTQAAFVQTSTGFAPIVNYQTVGRCDLADAHNWLITNPTKYRTKSVTTSAIISYSPDTPLIGRTAYPQISVFEADQCSTSELFGSQSPFIPSTCFKINDFTGGFPDGTQCTVTWQVVFADICGNQVCEGNENFTACSTDCTAPPPVTEEPLPLSCPQTWFNEQTGVCEQPILEKLGIWIYLIPVMALIIGGALFIRMGGKKRR